MEIDRKIFFDGVRSSFPNKRLTIGQVQGLDAICSEWELRYGHDDKADLRWLANIMAQSRWETGQKMQPVQELGGTAYLTRLYDVTGSTPKRAIANGNTTPGDGVKYSGKGHIQLTWKSNYSIMGARLGVDLVNHPEYALDPVISVKIMFEGMIFGLFTGRKLGNYINANSSDPMGARAVVNGDRNVKPKGALLTIGQQILAWHLLFYKELQNAKKSGAQPIIATSQVLPVPEQAPSVLVNVKPKGSWFARLFGL